MSSKIIKKSPVITKKVIAKQKPYIGKVEEDAVAVPVITKKVIGKKAAPVVAKKVKAPAEKKETAKSMIADMLFAQEYTDAEIYELVIEKFPDTARKAYISITRSDINSGRTYKNIAPEKIPLVRYTRDAKGKLIPFSEREDA